MNSYIVELKKSELRPCYANGEKAFFHKWEEKSRIVEPSPMIGGHGGGVLKYTLAIVEYESGEVAEVEPSKIRFIDTAALMEQYDFSCSTDDFLNKKFNFPKDDEAAESEGGAE